MRAKIDVLLIFKPRARAARAPSSSALRLSTGNAPGNPRQVGHVFAFGSSPKRVAQPQKIFDSVLSCAWISSPMMVSQGFMADWVFGLGQIGNLAIGNRQLPEPD